MVVFNLPSDAASLLERAFGSDLERPALESLVIEGYRTGRLTAGEVARILGLAHSIEAVDWLGRRGIALNYSLDDLRDDRATIAELFPEART